MRQRDALSLHHQAGLKIELIWWTLGVVLVTGYFTYVYRSSAGKVTLPQDGNE
jgi:hypothetical protein